MRKKKCDVCGLTMMEDTLYAGAWYCQTCKVVKKKRGNKWIVLRIIKK